MKYSEIINEVKGKPEPEMQEIWETFSKDTEKMLRNLKSIDEDLYDEYLNDLYIAAFGEHFNEKLYKKAVEEMVFVIPEYKQMHTPEQIEQTIRQMHQQASQLMSKNNKVAAMIPASVNKWDMAYVFNMICSDYPLTHGGDVNKIAMMAYEFISDPDADCGKSYRYYCEIAE